MANGVEPHCGDIKIIFEIPFLVEQTGSRDNTNGAPLMQQLKRAGPQGAPTQTQRVASSAQPIFDEAMDGGYFVKDSSGAPYLFDGPTFQPTGLADLSSPAAKEWVKSHMRKALDDKTIDAVAIATSVRFHFPMAKASLLAGKDPVGVGDAVRPHYLAHRDTVARGEGVERLARGNDVLECQGGGVRGEGEADKQYGGESEPKHKRGLYRLRCRISMLLYVPMNKTVLVMLVGLVCTAAAQTTGSLGIFEGASDVGTPSHKGSVVYNADRKEYRVTGGGNNMWGARDDFFFVWRKVTGDEALPGLRHRRVLAGRLPHDDRAVGGAGILRSKGDRLGQIVGAAAHQHARHSRRPLGRQGRLLGGPARQLVQRALANSAGCTPSVRPRRRGLPTENLVSSNPRRSGEGVIIGEA